MSSSEDRDPAGNVLAVDDCPAMREIMRATLEGRGYSVQAVDSGWAALDAVSQSVFDVIVLDVEMPGLDGMAVGRALRSAPRTAGSAIAMHSSMSAQVSRATTSMCPRAPTCARWASRSIGWWAAGEAGIVGPRGSRPSPSCRTQTEFRRHPAARES